MRYSKIIFYTLLLTSCVTPYDVKTSQYVDTMVVEGLITNEPGPYLVKISKAVPIQYQLKNTEWVTGAVVTIKDDQGNSEKLIETSPGNYYTSSTQGQVGRSYSISIVTKEGQSYESTKQKMLPVGDFSNLRVEFAQNETPSYQNRVKSLNGFNIYLDSDVLPEQETRVWWRWAGTFEILAYPRLRTKPVRRGVEIVDVPDPAPCSGYIYDTRYQAFFQTGPCTCCTCWVTQYNPDPQISDAKFINNGKIYKQQIGFIEANVRTFYDKYYLQVEQLSVSQEVYDFWKIVKLQKGNSSNLFQVPPPKSNSNIYSTTSSGTLIVGYFTASSVKSHTLTIERNQVPYKLYEIDTLPMSCVDAYKYSSNKKPLFW